MKESSSKTFTFRSLTPELSRIRVISDTVLLSFDLTSANDLDEPGVCVMLGDDIFFIFT